jgi:hypothetical protein
MKKSLFLIVLGFVSTSLFAYSDLDMDGVDDSIDRCPNTPFTDLVDINGCSKKSLISPHHFDIIVGASYSDSNYVSLDKTTTYANSLQVDYYYKNFSIQVSTSYYNSNGNGYNSNGLYDSFVGASYQFKPTNSLSFRVGAGILLPTYVTSLNNNNTDYKVSTSLSYNLYNSLNIFGGYSYTMINDDDVRVTTNDVNGTITDYQYKDSIAYSLGIGSYLSKKLYMNCSYNVSTSIYKSYSDIKTASIYSYYSIDKHWFSTFTYAYGLSDTASDNYVALRLGYFF